jgi:hypothetical protein
MTFCLEDGKNGPEHFTEPKKALLSLHASTSDRRKDSFILDLFSVLSKGLIFLCSVIKPGNLVYHVHIRLSSERGRTRTEDAHLEVNH